MRPIRLAILLAVLVAPGCWGGGETATIPTRDLPPPPPSPELQAMLAPLTTDPEATGPMAELAGLRAPLENEFLAADKASECPLVSVTSPQGKTDELQLGRAGYVTVVVVWGLDTRVGKASVLVVNDLVRKYASVGVRGVSIVEMTDDANLAPQFATEQQIVMPLYYDDLKQSALRTLSGEVGAKQERAVPSIFIIDRRLKLRFYRPGFRYNMTAAVVEEKWTYKFFEDAPAEQRVEHYVTQILQEKDW